MEVTRDTNTEVRSGIQQPVAAANQPFDAPEMPQYRLEIRALPLASVEFLDSGGAILYPQDEFYEPIKVTREWVASVPSFFVNRDCGVYVWFKNRSSWMPTTEFDDAYKPVS